MARQGRLDGEAAGCLTLHMGKIVLIQNPELIYDDAPGQRYHFPRQYLGAVESALDDWVVFYESRAGRGRFGDIGVQRLLRIEPDPVRPGHFYAILDPASALDFETTVPRTGPDGRVWERSLGDADARPRSGGANTAAVRRLDEAAFRALLAAGLPEAAAACGGEAPFATPAQIDDPPGDYVPAPLAGLRPEVLSSRPFRDRAFAAAVKRAYGGRCALSGLELRNGGGRAEVEAAHILPVAQEGPDIVRNGLALSGTLHWMFDRGLVSVADDHSILVARNKVPGDVVDRLIHPDGRLLLPEDPRDRPHPAYLKWHRENCYGVSGPP